MTGFHISQSTRLSVVIGISFCFFAAEITAGFLTHSLALVADAFHYLNDLVGFVVALLAIKVSERGKAPKEFSFGWQRAKLLGAFFNGVFLAALGLSIFLQSVERFVSLTKVENPRLVLIIGAVGLGLNLISATFLHEHGHDHGHGHSHGHAHSHSHEQHADESTSLQTSAMELGATAASFNAAGPGVHANHRHLTQAQNRSHGRDLGMMGVLIHVLGDALNNVAVMASAAAIWWGKGEGRFYADPAVGMGIAFMILASSVPLVKSSGQFLLQSAPAGLDVGEMRKDLEDLPGILSVHELHVWRLNQEKTIASAHVMTEDPSLDAFMAKAKDIGECLHAYGVHSYTLQPELVDSSSTTLNATAVGVDHGDGMVVVDDGIGVVGAHVLSSSSAEVRRGPVVVGGGRGGPGLRARTESGNVCRVRCQTDSCVPLQCCD